MNLKVKVFSDAHGYLPAINEEFDLLLIAGDITPALWRYSNIYNQKDWLKNEFRDWLITLPFRNGYSKVFLVPGNHDGVFEKLPKEELDEVISFIGNRLELLIHEEKQFIYLDEDNNEKSLRIFGTPYCKKFGDWSFMKTKKFLNEAFSQIPTGLDVLVTHDPPTLNNMGLITQGWQYGKEAGNEILAKYVLKAKPKYLFSGHIHSGNHILQEYKGIMMANVSHVDEAYNPVFDVLTFEIEK